MNNKKAKAMRKMARHIMQAVSEESVPEGLTIRRIYRKLKGRPQQRDVKV